jgi:hypothetical protein
MVEPVNPLEECGVRLVLPLARQRAPMSEMRRLLYRAKFRSRRVQHYLITAARQRVATTEAITPMV